MAKVLPLLRVDEATNVIEYQRVSDGVWTPIVTSAGALARPPQGRGCLVSGQPVVQASVFGGTTVYYTPYVGNSVPLWNGSDFIETTFSEVSQATTDATKSPAACAANSNYDVFGWSDAGTFRATRGPAWTSDTARGTGAGTTELQLVSGWWVNKNAITNGPGAGAGIYLFSIRTNGAGTVDFIYGSAAAGGGESVIGLWNVYNAVPVATLVQDSNAAHTYNVAAYRAYDNSGSMFAGAIVGLPTSAVTVQAQSHVRTSVNSAQTYKLGIGVDSTTVPSGTEGIGVGVSVLFDQTLSAIVAMTPAPLGYHYYQLLEFGNASAVPSFGGPTFDGILYRGAF